MKTLFAAATILLSTSTAFAGSCPKKLALIDKALSVGTVQNAEQVKTLRDKGAALHNSGDHDESVEILVKAMTLGGIKSQKTGVY